MKQKSMNIVTYIVVILIGSCNVLFAQASRGAVPVGGSAPPAPSTTTGGQSGKSVSSSDSADIERLKKEHLHWNFGGDITYSAPKNDFKTIMDSLNKSWGMGFGFNGSYTFAPVPVSVGAVVNFLFYGSEEKIYKTRHNVGGFPYYSNDTVNTSNSIIPLSLFARFEPDLGILKPYLEASVGFTVLSSSHNIKLDTRVAPNYDSTSTSAPFHYGVGAGVKIKIADIYNIPISRNAVYLNLQTRFLFGDYSTYSLRSYDESSQAFIITTRSSRTDMMLVNLGVLFEF